MTKLYAWMDNPQNIAKVYNPLMQRKQAYAKDEAEQLVCGWPRQAALLEAAE